MSDHSILLKTKDTFYKKKDGIFSETIFRSKQHHQKIEIVPENKENCSLSDFISFACATYPKFITSWPEKSAKKIVSSFNCHFKC